MASKPRIASSILEKFLEDPEVGAQDCLLYLQELHDLPAIRETFTVNRDGGFQSRFNKTKRNEIVESLTAINDIVFDFILNFTSMIIPGSSFKWPVIQLTNSEREVHIFVSAGKIRQKEGTNRIKHMEKRWPNFESSVKYECIDFYFPNSLAVSSAGRIYWDKLYCYKVLDVKQVKYHGEYFYVKVVSRDIGPNDDILYVLENLTNACVTNEKVYYLRLQVTDLKNNHEREFKKALPSITYDTSWVMRVLKNKIVLCNGYGEVFVFSCDIQDQLNLECSFSLPSIDIPPEQLRDVTIQP